ncbi:MAG: serine hydrolase domain-containing protein [Caulobacteraceae bacterium]
MSVQGFVAPGFEGVRDAFEANFDRPGDYQELGAALAAYRDGRLVVDLSGGFADAARTRPWTSDTLVNIWSATKGVVAAAVAVLVDRGLIDYEDRVIKIWPEFGQAGKDRVTIAQVLSHQAGLPGFAEPTSLEDQFDFADCAHKLERQAPAWTPGEATSYHAMTFGWLAGEIVRLVNGRSVGAFIAEAIADPIGADIYVGLPDSEEHRVAEIVAPRRQAAPPNLPPAALMALTNPAQSPTAPNRRAWRAAEIPAANGQASALGLARLYAALVGGGALEGARLLSPEGIARMTAPATADGRVDQFLGFIDAWAMGVALNRPGIYGPNPDTFGHSGWGGSFGCADPEGRIAIGYVCNQMGPELVGDPRTAGLCQSILDAAGRHLGAGTAPGIT